MLYCTVPLNLPAMSVLRPDAMASFALHRIDPSQTRNDFFLQLGPLSLSFDQHAADDERQEPAEGKISYGRNIVNQDQSVSLTGLHCPGSR